MQLIEDILNERVVEYNFTTEDSLDNVQSLNRFIDDFDLLDRVTFWDGTYLELDEVIAVHSGGNGDFCSHKIRFELL